MVNECTGRTIEYLEDFNDQEDGRYYGPHSSWIIINTSHKGVELEFKPDRDVLKKMFEDIITKSVSRICQKHK